MSHGHNTAQNQGFIPLRVSCSRPKLRSTTSTAMALFSTRSCSATQKKASAFRVDTNHSEHCLKCISLMISPEWFFKVAFGFPLRSLRPAQGDFKSPKRSPLKKLKRVFCCFGLGSASGLSARRLVFFLFSGAGGDAKMTLFTGSQRVADKLAVELKGKARCFGSSNKGIATT